MPKGLAGSQAFQCNQTLHSECKHFCAVRAKITANQIYGEALSGLLLLKHTSHHIRYFSAGIRRDLVPPGLFVWIKAQPISNTSAASFPPSWAIIEGKSIQNSTNPERAMHS